jgi:hypothetical protein
MSVEGPRIDDGWSALSTANDARRSSLSGTTLPGPNGSGQFLGVVQSTVAFTVSLASSTSGISGSSLGLPYMGILQNTPGPGQAADVTIFGNTKAVAGLATITPGNLLQFSSTAGGVIVPYLGGNGRAIGFAKESAGAVGQVFSMALAPFGTLASST